MSFYALCEDWDIETMAEADHRANNLNSRISGPVAWHHHQRKSLQETTMSSGRRVEIREQRRLFDDFFKVDEVVVAYQRYDGAMSRDERRSSSSSCRA